MSVPDGPAQVPSFAQQHSIPDGMHGLAGGGLPAMPKARVSFPNGTNGMHPQSHAVLRGMQEGPPCGRGIGMRRSVRNI